MLDHSLEEAQRKGVLGSHGTGLIGREAYLICHRGKADRTWAVCALV